MEKSGIDLPGEASSIMHQIDNVGDVELATKDFLWTVFSDHTYSNAAGSQCCH